MNAGVRAKERFVDANGEDRDGVDCGGQGYAPCATLSRAVTISEEGENIYIMARENDVSPFHWCHDSPVVINSSVTISGYNGKARVGCERGSSRMLLFNITGRDMRQEGKNVTRNVMEVVFRDIVFTDALFHVSWAKVTFSNCIIRDSKWMSVPGNPHIGFHVMNSEWIGSWDDNCTEHCSPTADLQIMAGYLDVYMGASSFYHSKVKITAAQSIAFLIEDCVFSNLPNMSSVHGGIYLTVNNGTLHSDLVVRDSIFEKQYYSEPIQSIMNLYEAALLMRVVNLATDNTESNVTASVDNCIFRDNERGLTFIGPFISTKVSNCAFNDNIAMHAGAGILYLTNVATPSFVENSTFDTNSAGAFRPGPVKNYQESFQVIGDEVRIHSNCCKGIISFVGKGGAIRTHRGNLTIMDCTFRNNTARLLGGAVFVDRGCKLTVDHAVMENSPIYQHATQGDLIYSNGMVAIYSIRLVILSAQNHVAVVRHSGDHWSIEVMDISIVCPVGYRLRVTNTSAYGVTNIGLRRSYKMDQLSYFCESCPRNKYSLDHGFMNFSLTYSSFAYYTLLINGEKPSSAYSGTYLYHDIECMQCPYGGRCQQGIRAVPNFWGYIQESHVLFQHCPKGYCCATTDCNGFDICAKHRTGTLCGDCEPGYSEALFSSKCVPDEECDPTWLWPVAVSSGMLYALFLFFQKDLRDLMFFKGVTIKEIPWPWCRKFRGNSLIASEHIQLEKPLRQAELENLRSDVDVEPDEHTERFKKYNNNEKQEKTDEEVEKEAEPAADPGAGFLIILFYYFQDAQLLHITTVFASADNKSKSMLKEILSGLFKFRVELFHFMDKLCFIQYITPSEKLLVKAVLVPYVLLQFGVLYVLYNWCQRLRGRRASTSAVSQGGDTKTFQSRLATAFVLALLFTYQKLATTSFTLLNCVPVGDHSVLFIEGSVDCYQVWQYGVIAYAGSCIVPFCIVLLIGPGLLKDGLISLPQFFCACIFPLPFLVYWVFLRLMLKGQRPEETKPLSGEAQAVISILQGPFKESNNRLFGPTCGAGVLIGRRLILVLLYTFVNDTLIRMLCMMLVCFIILLHHVHVLPYKDTRGNLAGSASAAALLLVGGINLVRAGFEAAEYVPQGPNHALMQVFEEVENVLLLWFPAFVMALMIISVTVKLFLYVMKCMFSPTEPAPTHSGSYKNTTMNHCSTTL